MRFLIASLLILMCSCSAKKELVKSETVNNESKVELAENVGVMEHAFNEVDTSEVCLSIVQDAVKFDTLGRVSEIKRTTAVKNKNNRISKAETSTAVQTSQTTSIDVKQDSTAYSNEKVGKSLIETYNLDVFFGALVFIVVLAVKRNWG